MAEPSACGQDWPSNTIEPEPLGVIVILLLLADTICFVLTSKLPPSCGVVSSTIFTSVLGVAEAKADLIGGIGGVLDAGVMAATGGFGGDGLLGPMGGTQSSDRRLKKDIKLIGLSPLGFKIYSFKYKDNSFGNGTFQGVMSDEVPNYAVIKSNGFDMVDYNKIDVEFKNI